MKRYKFIEWIGFKFIVNHNSKEIHRVNYLTNNCFIDNMVKSEYAKAWKVKRLLKKGFNGCHHCYRAEDRG